MVKFGKNGFDSSDSSLQGLGKIISSFQTTVSGCTTPSDGGVPNINYNGAATIDDGSCTPQVIGCMDASAGNFDATANTAGACSYPGCMDPSFEEYDPNATTSDGSCSTVISYGCVDTDTYAPGDGFTYPLYANAGSFTFPCDDTNGPGCIGANTGDNCCCEATVLGCTDGTANNYAPGANYNYNPGSIYACDYTYTGCTYPTACNYDPGATGIPTGCGYCGDSDANNFDNVCSGGFGDQINACQFCTRVGHDIPNPQFNLYPSHNQIVVQWTEPPGGWSTSNYQAVWFQPNWDPSDMVVVPAEVTDPTADNFGSFVEVGLLENPYAHIYTYELRYKNMNTNLYSAWTTLDASNVKNWQEEEYTGVQPSEWFGQLMPSGVRWYEGPYGADRQTATLLYRIQGLDPSTSYLVELRSVCSNSVGNLPNGAAPFVSATTTASSTFGCIDPAACNYDATALYAWNDDCDYVNCIVPGCTDPNAENYDPNANQDDGNCIACVYGCMEGGALNFDATVTCNDNSCISAVYGCMDASVFNYNPTANVDDGSCCYVAGCGHPEAYNFDDNVPFGCNDGSCNYIEVLGCIDPTADNYAGNTDYPNPNTAGTDGGGMDACFPGYQEELYTGTVGDSTNWNSGGGHTLHEEDGAVRIENVSAGGWVGSKLYLRDNQNEFSEDLVTGKSYRLEFDVRVSDDPDGFNNNAAQVMVYVRHVGVSIGVATTSYDGYHSTLFNANGYYYEKRSIHFVANSSESDRIDISMDQGENIWIKNISLKQENVIVNVTSIMNMISYSGDRFHFDESVMSAMLEVVDDPGNNTWSGTQINVSQWRAGLLLWSGDVTIHDSSHVYSQPNGWGGDLQGFGIKVSGASAGDWEYGDQIRMYAP